MQRRPPSMRREVGALDQPPDVVVAAEIDRRVLLVEGEEAGIGRAAGREVEAALPHQRDLGQPPGEAIEAARLVADEVELLQVVADELVAVRRADQREDRLAARACLGELGEAPLRIEPVPGQDQDHRLGAVELVIELLLPALTRRDALVLVDVEEALLEALRLEPGEDLLRLFPVPARMGDEDARHGPVLYLAGRPHNDGL